MGKRVKSEREREREREREKDCRGKRRQARGRRSGTGWMAQRWESTCHDAVNANVAACRHLPHVQRPLGCKSANDEERRGGVWVSRPACYRTTVSPPAPAIAVNETTAGNYPLLGHPSEGAAVFSPCSPVVDDDDDDDDRTRVNAATRCWGRLQLRDALAAAAAARWRPADDGGGAALAREPRRRVATEGTW